VKKYNIRKILLENFVNFAILIRISLKKVIYLPNSSTYQNLLDFYFLFLGLMS
jgi:hypothetical protein